MSLWAFLAIAIMLPVIYLPAPHFALPVSQAVPHSRSGSLPSGIRSDGSGTPIAAGIAAPPDRVT
jgi:hypothetical protein